MCLKNLALYRIPRLPSLVIMNVWWWPWYELLLTPWCQRAIANGAASWTQTCNVLCPWALFRETAVMFFFFKLCMLTTKSHFPIIAECLSKRLHTDYDVYVAASTLTNASAVWRDLMEPEQSVYVTVLNAKAEAKGNCFTRERGKRKGT